MAFLPLARTYGHVPLKTTNNIHWPSLQRLPPVSVWWSIEKRKEMKGKHKPRGGDQGGARGRPDSHQGF